LVPAAHQVIHRVIHQERSVSLRLRKDWPVACPTSKNFKNGRMREQNLCNSTNLEKKTVARCSRGEMQMVQEHTTSNKKKNTFTCSKQDTSA